MPLAGGPIFATSSSLNSWIDDVRLQWRWPAGGESQADAIAGPETETQPVSEIPSSIAGKLALGFAMLDWYNKVHVYPRTNDLGNIVANQTIIVRVWNAYFVDRVLNGINETDTDGLYIDRPRPDPVTFAPLELLEYSITVLTEGPPNIEATYTFDFDVIDISVTFTGSRIVVWMWPPNGEVLERLEWLTNIIQSYDGTEQRQQLRSFPRRFFEFDLLLEGKQRRDAETAIFGWGGHAFALPVWMDGGYIDAPVAPGAMSVPFSTSGRDYHLGGLAILINDNDFEVLTISAIAAGSITLLREVTGSWPATSMIYPLRTARIDGELMTRRFTGDTAYGRVRFRCTDSSAWAPASDATYRGFPVLTQIPNWTEDITHTYARLLSVFDPGVGQPMMEDRVNAAQPIQLHNTLAMSRAEITNLRAWLYASRGRYGAAWVPTWAYDINVVVAISSAAVTIDVEHQNLSTQLNALIGRRDMRIKLKSGAIYYRRINGVAEQSATVERLSIDAALGVTVQPDDIEIISFMALARLDSDAVELRWWKHDAVETTFNLRAISNDV